MQWWYVIIGDNPSNLFRKMGRVRIRVRVRLWAKVMVMIRVRARARDPGFNPNSNPNHNRNPSPDPDSSRTAPRIKASTVVRKSLMVIARVRVIMRSHAGLLIKH